MIAIVDYGVGNLFSLASSVRALGAEVCVTRRADDLRAAADDAEMMTEIGINAFVDRTGMTADEVRALMKVYTWLTPAQALDYGIATSITQDAALPVAQDAKKAIMQRVLNPPEEKTETKPKEESAEKTLMQALAEII